MAIALAQDGGIGIVHRNLNIKKHPALALGLTGATAIGINQLINKTKRKRRRDDY